MTVKYIPLRFEYNRIRRSGLGENNIREKFGKLLIKWGEYKIRTSYKKKNSSNRTNSRKISLVNAGLDGETGSGDVMLENLQDQIESSSVVNVLENSSNCTRRNKRSIGRAPRRIGRNDISLKMNDPTELDIDVPTCILKEDVLMIAPTIKKMANPVQNERITLSLFDYKTVYVSSMFKVKEDVLKKCKAIWFFGHGLNHYDKLDIILPNNEKYDMTNFFIDNPNLSDIDFVFDVCYSSSLLLDYNFMQEVIKRKIRLYTCGFGKELNTPNGSLLSYCLKSIQKIVGNVFKLSVKQMNAWFSVISDICGYKMYCYGKDDSTINPTPQEKQMAAALIRPFLSSYFRMTGIGTILPRYTSSRVYGVRVKKNLSFGIN